MACVSKFVHYPKKKSKSGKDVIIELMCHMRDVQIAGKTLLVVSESVSARE
jgi:hypothetical protein